MSGIIVPSEGPGSKPAYHLYVIRTQNRKGLMQYLNENGIGTGLSYRVVVFHAVS